MSLGYTALFGRTVYSLEDLESALGPGVNEWGGLVTFVVAGVDEVVVEALVLWTPCGLFIVPNKLPRPPIWPTPPNNCISCCCDMLFSKFWRSPSALVPPLLWDPGVGGLLSTSLIFLQCSSSLSVLRSYTRKIFCKIIHSIHRHLNLAQLGIIKHLLNYISEADINQSIPSTNSVTVSVLYITKLYFLYL